MAETYTAEQRLAALTAALQAIAPTVTKRIEPDDVAALADSFARSFAREPLLEVVDAIDAWSRDTTNAGAMPGPGAIWRWLGELRRQRAAQAATPVHRGGEQGALFGGAKGDPIPDYLRHLAGERALTSGPSAPGGQLGLIFRSEIVGHQHKDPGAAVDVRSGCAACEVVADRRAQLAELLAQLPNTGGTQLSTCRGCDGSGLVEVLAKAPAWQGIKTQTIWARCPVCNPIPDAKAG